ncbi:hypothetical protein Dsin_020820 [Dipteronia sinensis]|uniref:Uncharacterized protein n=1 Tax=Dipteronia sinensis TaxID=43782 RepID=A0AAE0E5B7_9ROSI|nr:hypothetical protein Dsin_020820 [Dipteronia sinensis]
MCKSKKAGGLGIGRMLDKNKSFLAKWMWRFGSEFDSLWRTVLCKKYGIRKESPLWEWIPNMNASSFVKAIGSLLASGSKTKKVIKEGSKVIIGDGNKADFWSFRIGDNSQLKSSCPRIYALANNKAGVVQEYDGKFTIRTFRHQLADSKEDDLVDFRSSWQGLESFGLGVWAGGVWKAAQMVACWNGSELGQGCAQGQARTECGALCFSP